MTAAEQPGPEQERPEGERPDLVSFEQRMRDEVARCGNDFFTAVHLIIGAASACWDNLPGAGVFRSEHAGALAAVLLEHIDAYRPATPTGDHRSIPAPRPGS